MAITQHSADLFFDSSPTPEDQPISKKAARRQKNKAEREAKQFRRMPKPIEPRNEKQRVYIESLQTNAITFGIGPAGVGKTYVPARVYGAMLTSGQIDKIYLARPNVSKPQHRNGFLPGDLKEKTEPWLIPIFEGLKDAMGPAEFDKFRKEGKIEEVPFEYIQGRTFKDAACIVDEAENLDLDDLYITLTRQGEGLSMVLCGDIYQSRIYNSGLAQVIEMSVEDGHEDTGIVVFTEDEVVRSKQAAQWVKSFKKRAHILRAPSPKGNSNLHSNVIYDIVASTDFANSPPAFLKGAA